MKIIKQEIQFEESLKQRLEFICEFSKVTPTFVNGSIRKLDKTNLSCLKFARNEVKLVLRRRLDQWTVYARKLYIKLFGDCTYE